MATITPDLPVHPESFASDLAGMPNFFIDPVGAARYVHRKWFWVAPVILVSLVSMVSNYVTTPVALHIAETAPPDGMSGAQYRHAMEIGLKVGMFLGPVFVLLIYSIQTLILLGMSAVSGVEAKFRQLFNLLAGCGLIQMLVIVATAVIVKTKSGIASMAELRPPLGLDIFLPEGSNKFLTALLGSFSVFEIWWFVMLALIFAVAFRTTKGKAFVIVSPLLILNFLLRLLGTLGQK